MNPIRSTLIEEPLISVVVYAPRRVGYERYGSDVVVFGCDATVIAEGFVGVQRRGRAGKSAYTRGLHTPSAAADLAIARVIDRSLATFAKQFEQIDREQQALRVLRARQEQALRTAQDAVGLFVELGERAGDPPSDIASHLIRFFSDLHVQGS